MRAMSNVIVDLAFVFSLFSLLAGVQKTFVFMSHTGSSKATDLGVTSIRIMTTPECEAFPCSVKRGTNVTIMIEFKDNGMFVSSVTVSV